MISSRHKTLWPLFKGCFLITVGLILAFFFLKLNVARSMVIWFGFISFGLVYLKEEIVRWVVQSKLSQAQHQRRFLLIGASEETARMRDELRAHPEVNMKVVAELDLNQTSLGQRRHPRRPAHLL
jgi:FlaA1/EpsC-like NDP-sugar epimerase